MYQQMWQMKIGKCQVDSFAMVASYTIEIKWTIRKEEPHRQVQFHLRLLQYQKVQHLLLLKVLRLKVQQKARHLVRVLSHQVVVKHHQVLHLHHQAALRRHLAHRHHKSPLSQRRRQVMRMNHKLVAVQLDDMLNKIQGFAKNNANPWILLYI